METKYQEQKLLCCQNCVALSIFKFTDNHFWNIKGVRRATSIKQTGTSRRKRGIQWQISTHGLMGPDGLRGWSSAVVGVKLRRMGLESCVRLCSATRETKWWLNEEWRRREARINLPNPRGLRVPFWGSEGERISIGSAMRKYDVWRKYVEIRTFHSSSSSSWTSWISSFVLSLYFFITTFHPLLPIL